MTPLDAEAVIEARSEHDAESLRRTDFYEARHASLIFATCGIVMDLDEFRIIPPEEDAIEESLEDRLKRTAGILKSRCECEKHD